ncbi:MAG: FesM [Chloroflexi bacterium]|nr:MAG: FesM [Chloroflexota bacterium]
MRLNMLRFPIVGRFLRWRRGRLVLQLGLLGITAVILYDGFTGPQIAPSNLASVITWVQFRGVAVFALLLVGNLFCMACPFALPRTLAHKLGRRGRRWPRQLRNKWTAIGVLFVYFWLYEWLDLWASPLLTVWVIVGYFVASFVLEAAFAESPFCKYVCPLGTFNFVSSTISPFQISVQNGDTCRNCVGKECVNGAVQVAGCGTELFAPQVESNLDCTLCLDCARACPHDNVALIARSPIAELTKQAAWPRRLDINLLVMIYAFMGVSNAFGMVPPVYAVEDWLMGVLNTTNEGVVLFLIFGVLNLLLPIGLGLGSAWASRRLANSQESLRTVLARYAPSMMPLAFAIWLTHFGGFHFLGSALGIIPVTQYFLRDHRMAWVGPPNWTLGPVLPLTWLDPLEMTIVLIGLVLSLVVLMKRAGGKRPFPDPPIAQLPWLLLLVGLAVAAMIIFLLPMEMRGSVWAG